MNGIRNNCYDNEVVSSSRGQCAENGCRSTQPRTRCFVRNATTGKKPNQTSNCFTCCRNVRLLSVTAHDKSDDTSEVLLSTPRKLLRHEQLRRRD